MPSGALLDDFQRFFDASVAAADGGAVQYSLPAPKWQFLCWLADTQAVLLHGTHLAGIAVLEPTHPDDESQFGHRRAVFASSDGIWAMFFAILDRAVAWSLVNACFSLRDADDGSVKDVRYYFSVNGDALVGGRGFSRGYVHVLPRRTFQREPPHYENGDVIESHQWASIQPVRPIGCVEVDPEDFPFLHEVRGHDPDVVRARAAAEPDGFPWT
jgi:hypothetical protein